MFIKIAGVYINVENIVNFYDVQNETNEFTHCHIVLKDSSIDTSLTAEEVMQKIKEAKCS